VSDTNNVYRERAHLVAHLATIYPSHIGFNDPSEPDWAVVTLETTEGQLTWHVSPDDMDLFKHVPTTTDERDWDGHGTDEKYERLRSLTKWRGRNA